MFACDGVCTVDACRFDRNERSGWPMPTFLVFHRAEKNITQRSVVRDSVFSQNTIGLSANYDMVFVSHASEITILNTTFADNDPGTLLSPSPKPSQPNTLISISGCTFESNWGPTELTQHASGVASVSNSVFRHNDFRGYKGAVLSVAGGKQATVHNCTFIGNALCNANPDFCGALVFTPSTGLQLEVDVSCSWFEANSVGGTRSSCIEFLGALAPPVMLLSTAFPSFLSFSFSIRFAQPCKTTCSSTTRRSLHRASQFS